MYLLLRNLKEIQHWFKKNSKLIDNSGCSPQLEGFDARAIELDKSIALCEHKCFLVARFHES